MVLLPAFCFSNNPNLHDSGLSKLFLEQDTQQLRLCVLDKECEVASLAQELQERRCQNAMLKLRLVSCEESIADLQNNSGQLFKRFKDGCVAHQRTQVAPAM